VVGLGGEWPSFDEVYGLVRSNLVGITERELNGVAVDGLLDRLHPKVLLTRENAAATSSEPAGPALAGQRVFDRSLVYIRVAQVESGLAGAFLSVLRGLADPSPPKGLVLDLRFAQGVDYVEAGRLADCLVASPRKLLICGDEIIEATAKTNVFDCPVVVLINGETRGAAEAVAAALRHAEVGLLLGSQTAGEASLFREFLLSNGRRLRIASVPIRVGDGREIAPAGIKPDIEVTVRADDERLFLEDPYRAIGRADRTAPSGDTNVLGSAGNRSGRMSEAELVRMRREGQAGDDEGPSPARAASAERPVVTDPVLARALDLLRGLAVLRPGR